MATAASSSASASTLITNIGELMTQDLEHRVLRNAAVVLEGEHIAWIGQASEAPEADVCHDAHGQAVLPGWVDSHTHLVFAGDRTAEFEARMAGQKYAAGGIGVTTGATRDTDTETLRSLVAARVRETQSVGTTYLETKTGYGLNVKDEVRSAQIASEFVDEVTFLGAHLVPKGVDKAEYVDLVTGAMLEGVLPHVRWIDVFCERGAFDEAESRAIINAGKARGLGVRVHGNQLGPGPGVRLAVETGAASVDHCNYMEDADIAALAESWSAFDAASGANPGTVAGLLPACDLSTREPLAPGRALLDAGAQVALASNCNPGSSYTPSMPFCVATAVLQMRLTVHEAVRAATYGGALALGKHHGAGAVGSIAVGHRADLQLLDAPSATHLAYRPGLALLQHLWQAGKQLF